MKTIIAATDFSPVSLNAVNYAADMATALQANLTLFNAYPVPVPIGEIPMPVYNTDDLEAEARNKLESLKDKLRLRTRERVIIHNEVRPGDPVTALSRYSEKVKPFAVVFGTETMGAVERFFYGGKTVQALKRMLWPLIIVPEHVTFHKYKKIGFACDFDQIEETVHIEEIKSFVGVFDASLHIIYAGGEEFKPGIASDASILRQMFGELNPEFHFLGDPDIEKSIISFAEQNDIDLLIVIPKQHPLTDLLFSPRHSKGLMLHSGIPVLSIHE